MANLAIIPARGGSKRIPRKNVKDFLGKPIIAYSIEAALSSGCFDEVMVSTDDPEIAEIAVKYGAKVPFMRSAKTSDDFATTSETLIEVINVYKELGREFKVACCLYPTAPFVTSSKLQQVHTSLNEGGFDALIPITPFSFPPQRGLQIKDNKIHYINQEISKVRSQDLETYYHDAGQFYFFKTEKILKYGRIMTSNTGYTIIPVLETQDIDNETDWKLAELKFKVMHQV